ncbi:hypothetical protein Fcan01_16909 [Folsomia candida]|uniref:Odorant receptor n=1 Tax=Folsomia candida TaxID=158441 RepID=A0A226DSZ0_FOLCA|nr:hypothetical protein Fcan01_16909 [Folsomia candida]
MFTDLFSQEFSKTIKTANRLGFSLIWDKTNGRHKCMPNSPHFNLLLVIWYAWMGMCVGVYTLADRPKEVARYWNGMFLLSVKIHDTYWNFTGSTAVSTYNRNWLLITRPAKLLMYPLPFLIWCQILITPFHPMYIPTIFSNYPALFNLAYFFYAPAMLYSHAIVASYSIILIQTFPGLLLFIFPLLQELTLSKKPREVRKFKCSPELVSHPKHLVHVYRSLQLAMRELRLLLGIYFPIMQIILGQLALATGYVLIAEGRKIKLATRMTFLTCDAVAVLFWVAMMTCAGKIQKSSKECLISWRVNRDQWESKEDRRYMSKFRKSCKPLYFGLDGFMTVTHKSVLKFVQGIIRGLFRTLLTLKEEE